MSKRNQMDRRTRRKQLPQSGYTQLLQGSRLATARSVQVDMHVKHCFEVCRAIKNKTAGEAIAFLNQVLKIDSNRADVRRKAAAVPFRLGSGNKRKRRSGPSMVGHRKGGIGPGRFPVKASREIIKVIESAMENARYQYEDIDAEEMLITHIAAHRGRIRKGWIPRARGRATPSNHYQVNLEVFLEDMNTTVDELEDEF
ncbi:50S ribosomal protein L22 [Candidatus Poseidonia alphae]|jgi:large subunit ribosomal protein L22|uniref:50S ribosomal protein L22 n=1 Tax=Candidatus Poseidonia alphae TaxID=1915863 RepID=UPI001DDEFDA6|nr:50S ribosomal protein L22 [Euryarchaeota archaeon]MDA8530573.1 50S ribosomal protein L22 [Candidatus Poseidonia alphae]MDA8638241.1 50S ribosomal protein L22 [Candidatus Poseidonia alphae]MDA8749393.1 50S ribosomal protein L22 [Candidatus Poseidonia alphae]MDA8759514.1 50S ribosomal protein L22 [Candidatus Poseidonia alphae]